MDNFENLHIELSNPIRTKILEELLFSPKKLNDIADKFTISKSEVSRHLSRLMEIETVTKDNSSRNFMLKPLGESYLNLIYPVKFLLSNSPYFKDHYIDLPIHLTRSIDSLTNAKFITGPGEVLTLAQKILNETESSVKLILDQKYPIKLSKKIANGKYVVTKEIFEKGGSYMKQFYESMEARIYGPINHNLFISDDNQGTLCFPSLDHRADMTVCFHITDKTGIQYLQEIWNYYWSVAPPGKTLRDLK